MKGVVLAGGTGSRLRPITFSMAKQLVPIANQAILFYGLQHLAEADITQVGMVIAPETGGEIRQAVGDGARFGLEVTYILQEEPLGLAHALKTASDFVGGDDVLMYLGDNLLKHGVTEVVRDFQELRPNCQILLSRVEDPTAFGVAELDEEGHVVHLVEKPKDPPSDLALVGVYLFDATVAEALEAIQPSGRGELEITDAIQYLLDRGRKVRASIVEGWWKDTGKKADLLHANQLVLGDLVEKIDGELIGCRVRGPVTVGSGSQLVDCDLTGPAVIGRDVHMTRVTLGPNTAIGDGSRLADCMVETSIVMEHSQIYGWKLRGSVIGRGVALRGSAPPEFVELTLGELSEIVAY
jgi:glucose-1-phosphate thymidylyltransferase